MARPRSPDPREKQVVTYVTQQTFEALDDLARERDTSRASVARQLIAAGLDAIDRREHEARAS